jgi:4-amino-4-deoxychorismate mutase
VNLASLRDQIDAVDAQIVAALARRFAIVDRVAEIKVVESIEMMQPGRVQNVKDRVRCLALQHHVDPDVVEHLYDVIIAETCAYEDKLIEAAATAGSDSA